MKDIFINKTALLKMLENMKSRPHLHTDIQRNILVFTIHDCVRFSVL